MYACMHEYMYACMHAYIHACMHSCSHTHMDKHNIYTIYVKLMATKKSIFIRGGGRVSGPCST